MAPKPPKLPKLAATDFLVAFGPNNTYLARAPAVSRSSLVCSPTMLDIISEAKSVAFAVFPPFETSVDDEGAADNSSPDPYLSYTKKAFMSDSKCYFPEEDYYPELKEWLGHRWGTGGLQVISNGKGGWWALSHSGTTKWMGLPGDARQLLKAGNPHGKVIHMALGVKNSYIALFEDGHVDWDLKGSYDRLDEHLDTRSQGELVYVSLSVYKPDQFFCVFKDTTVIYDFPKGAEDLDEDFLDAEGLRVIVKSDTAKHTGLYTEAKPSRPGTLRKISEDTAEGVVEDVAEKTIELALGLDKD
ncbi:MAG: hypothetical protein M1819_002470 [Sarea resinae]|nr:MAG: hypothetical protein M1819_002470 [Sarea resinae]